MKKMTTKMIASFLMFFVLCSGVFMTSFGIQANADEKIPEELGFLYYCDLDELTEWDSSLGYLDEEQAAEMRAYMDAYIIKGETDDYEIASRIYDWIGDNVEYSYEYSYLDPYDVFTLKSAVCGGYSNLYKAMLNLADIPAVLVSGMTPYGAHVWNAVYADGRWFYSDATWKDPYFDRGADVFMEDHFAQRVENVYVQTTDGLLIGYDTGIAVAGVADGITDVVVPDFFEEFCISSVSYKLFNYNYGIKSLSVGMYVTAIDTASRCETLESITVSKDNYTYASKDGALFTKDMKELLIYPANKKSESFVLPKETIAFDIKQAFENAHLVNLEVEEGNPEFSSYEGALYDADQKELLMVPLGKTEVIVPADASIGDVAFANADTSKMTIYSEAGSPAHQYAQANGIAFKTGTPEPTPEVTPTPDVTPEPTPTPEPVKEKVTEVFPDVKAGAWYVNGVQYVYDNGLMSGSNGLFNPTADITRAQLVTTLYRLAGEPEVTDKAALTELSDVAEGKYYTDAVCWAYAEGVTTGTDGKFNPTAKLTRQQMAAFFFRYAEVMGMDTTARGDYSSMVNADKLSGYAAEPMAWAVGAGLISGSDVNVNGVAMKDLNPRGNTTRAQVAVILQRFCEK